jgi:hypothetical protein
MKGAGLVIIPGRTITRQEGSRSVIRAVFAEHGITFDESGLDAELADIWRHSSIADEAV